MISTHTMTAFLRGGLEIELEVVVSTVEEDFVSKRHFLSSSTVESATVVYSPHPDQVGRVIWLNDEPVDSFEEEIIYLLTNNKLNPFTGSHE